MHAAYSQASILPRWLSYVTITLAMVAFATHSRLISSLLSSNAPPTWQVPQHVDIVCGILNKWTGSFFSETDAQYVCIVILLLSSLIISHVPMGVLALWHATGKSTFACVFEARYQGLLHTFVQRARCFHLSKLLCTIGITGLFSWMTPFSERMMYVGLQAVIALGAFLAIASGAVLFNPVRTCNTSMAQDAMWHAGAVVEALFNASSARRAMGSSGSESDTASTILIPAWALIAAPSSFSRGLEIHKPDAFAYPSSWFASFLPTRTPWMHLPYMATVLQLAVMSAAFSNRRWDGMRLSRLLAEGLGNAVIFREKQLVPRQAISKVVLVRLTAMFNVWTPFCGAFCTFLISYMTLAALEGAYLALQETAEPALYRLCCTYVIVTSLQAVWGACSFMYALASPVQRGQLGNAQIMSRMNAWVQARNDVELAVLQHVYGSPAESLVPVEEIEAAIHYECGHYAFESMDAVCRDVMTAWDEARKGFSSQDLLDAIVNSLFLQWWKAWVLASIRIVMVLFSLLLTGYAHLHVVVNAWITTTYFGHTTLERTGDFAVATAVFQGHFSRFQSLHLASAEVMPIADASVRRLLEMAQDVVQCTVVPEAVIDDLPAPSSWGRFLLIFTLLASIVAGVVLSAVLNVHATLTSIAAVCKSMMTPLSYGRMASCSSINVEFSMCFAMICRSLRFPDRRKLRARISPDPHVGLVDCIAILFNSRVRFHQLAPDAETRIQLAFSSLPPVLNACISLEQIGSLLLAFADEYQGSSRLLGTALEVLNRCRLSDSQSAMFPNTGHFLTWALIARAQTPRTLKGPVWLRGHVLGSFIPEEALECYGHSFLADSFPAVRVLNASEQLLRLMRTLNLEAPANREYLFGCDRFNFRVARITSSDTMAELFQALYLWDLAQYLGDSNLASYVGAGLKFNFPSDAESGMVAYHLQEAVRRAYRCLVDAQARERLAEEVDEREALQLVLESQASTGDVAAQEGLQQLVRTRSIASACWHDLHRHWCDLVVASVDAFCFAGFVTLSQLESDGRWYSRKAAVLLWASQQ